ncbi:DNA repair protein [Vibrio splendidus]|uniref:DNA repair protein n=1 Tax=Vibrio splendidus TaxID=29497 RepID=UPI000C818705|nr:DNA repair protein [Vibrio splendidus]PMH01698.1 DNA repair protein [Vibrio splendidus]
MNVHTNELTDSQVRESVKQKYVQEMLNARKDPEKGTSFDIYLNAFEEARAAGKPFKNPTQLQDAVGGKYTKVQIVFSVLDTMQSRVTRSYSEIPEWFSAPIESAIKLDLNALWQAVEQDISQVVETRVKVAEHQAELKRQQVIQSSETIEDLQDKLAELEPLPDQLSELTEEKSNLCDEVQRLKNLVQELQVSSDASFEYQRTNAVLAVEKDRLLAENDLLRTELTQCSDILQQTLIEKAKLEGRLAERNEVLSNNTLN